VDKEQKMEATSLKSHADMIETITEGVSKRLPPKSRKHSLHGILTFLPKDIFFNPGA
jgi:hypothetical protein